MPASFSGAAFLGLGLPGRNASRRPPFTDFANTMEFQIEKNSPVPVINQIQEQIKMSMAIGVLKRGDILPSIREVEKQTGINRGQIHRAYLALHQSGLISQAPGKRLAVTVSAAAPDLINRKCLELARDTIKRARRIGVSPIAFARYLGRNSQEDERDHPFIAYVDVDKGAALRRAEQVSQIWGASVIGLTVDEFKLALGRGSKLKKVLVNHLHHDRIRCLPRGRKIDVIPIHIRYTKQIIRDLQETKANASLVIVLPNHAVPVARFIVEQLYQLIKCREISWMSVKEAPDFNQLLNNSRYDRILVSPGARDRVPVELHQNARILMLQMQLDPEDLETARIRAGVII